MPTYAFVGIMYERNGVLPNRVADAIDPGDQDETDWNALSLKRRHPGSPLGLG
jgi:hypothetical protein